MSRHIVSTFEEELRSVTSKIGEMGGFAEDLLSQCLEAVQNRDVDLAKRVVTRDARLDKMERDIEEVAIRILALRQPMAGDLHLVITALKLASTLERIGDLAKNIARRSQYLASHAPAPISASIVRMGRQVLVQLTDVLDAYSSRDTAKAIAVWRRDIDVDEMYNSIFREIITYMIEDPRTITLGSQLLFVAKNLERIGDHTTFVAEMVHLVVEGEPISDDRPKGAPADALLGE